MKAINQLRKRKGVSPVIATVILVAVTITVAVAVAYWMSGIAGQYTQFEKIEIQSGYAVKIAGGWDITITLKNSGTSTATLISLFINEKIVGEIPYDTVSCIQYDATPAEIDSIVGGTNNAGITVESGKSVTVTIEGITDTMTSSGTTMNAKLHSAAGMDYIRLITLP